MALTKIPNNLITVDAIDGTLIADNAINSEHYTDGSIDLAHMSVNSIDSDQYIDGSIDLAHMSANSIDSTQYVDGSIDTVHIGADQITSALIADDQIDSEHIVDGSIDLAHMSVNSIDSDQYIDGSIDNAHLADDAVGVAELSATGSASSSTYLRGDNSWAALTAASITSYTNSTNNRVLTSVDSSTVNSEANLTFDGSTLAVTGALTASGLITSTGHIHYPDSVQAIFGTGSDAYIKFDGNNFHINNNYGVLYIDQNKTDGNLILRSDDSSGGLAEYIVLDGGGGNTLLKGGYGNTKLATTSTGVEITGTITENNIPTRSRAIAMAMVWG